MSDDEVGIEQHPVNQKERATEYACALQFPYLIAVSMPEMTPLPPLAH